MILEAREACSGASEGNGGHLRPDLFPGPAARARRTGDPAAADGVARFELGTCCRLVLPEQGEGERGTLELPLGSCGIAPRCPDTVESYYGVQADGSLVVGAAGRTGRSSGGACGMMRS
ncbi:hypothetical protein F4810DRAFT_715033 [Camillea tinctor]|nr:hypothetical protein F4810DRAFT_715033 [Camillea tinctor]